MRPVIGLDIDGTLAHYHQHFIAFAEAYCGKEIRPDYDGSVPFWKWCGLSRATYRQVKLAYRQGGLKRSMPYDPYAAEMTRTLRKAGAEVVVCTTRPYLHLSNIEPDTLHSLKRNGIQYDNVIMGQHKYRQLAREYGVHAIVMVLEDEEQQLKIARSLGLPAVLRRGVHNSNVEWTPEVGSLNEFAEVALSRIAAYKNGARG